MNPTLYEIEDELICLIETLDGAEDQSLRAEIEPVTARSR